VLAEDRAQTLLHAGARHDRGHVAREVVERPAAGRDFEGLLVLLHARDLRAAASAVPVARLAFSTLA